MMQTAGEGLRQAFMSKEEYQGLREEERVWREVKKQLCMVGVTLVWIAMVVAIAISVDIVFAVTGSDYPFCLKRRLEHMKVGGDSERDPGIASYAFTEEEAVQYYWAAVFLPTSVVFTITVIYLFAGLFSWYQVTGYDKCMQF
jgi:hypothetical protein